MKSKSWKLLLDEIHQAALHEVEISVRGREEDESVYQSRQVMGRLEQVLKTLRVSISTSKNLSRDEFKVLIRKRLIAEINEMTWQLLGVAEQAILEVKTSKANLWINTNGDSQKPQFEEFDFDNLPFLSLMPEALMKVRLVRALREKVQWQAFNFLYVQWELDEAVFTEQISSFQDEQLDKQEMQRLKQAITSAQQRHRWRATGLPKEVVETARDFYDCMLGNTLAPFALPISIPIGATESQMRQIAESFRSFGNLLDSTHEIVFKHRGKKVPKATESWIKYEAAGVGFLTIAAWLRALDLTWNRRICSVCFRHASAKSRCHEHLTKEHENPSARRDKQVRSLYETRLTSYLQKPYVKKLMQSGLSWPDAASEELIEAANRYSDDAWLQERSLFLARQLRMLLPTLSARQMTNLGSVFEQILAAAKVLVERAKLSNAARERAEIRSELWELLSLKGVLRILCGSGIYSSRIGLKMCGLDRNHPVLHQAAVAPADLVKLLLQQRSWAEASDEFELLVMPSADHILALLDEGKTKQEAATLLGISLSGLYKILSRGDQPRERQYFGKDRFRDSL